LKLQMDGRKAENYSSNAQRIRVITEDWVDTIVICFVHIVGINISLILKITDRLQISFVHLVWKNMS
jgi:hypothetical protein